MSDTTVLILLALTVLPHAIGILWALTRRSALMIVLAILFQRAMFLWIFISLFSDIRQDAPQHGAFVLMFLILAIANTMLLVDSALVIAGLKPRKR